MGTDDSAKPPVHVDAFEEQLERAAAIVGEFPGGSLVGHAIMGVVQRRQNRRLNDFLQRMLDDLRELEDQVNHEYMESDEFADLVEEIVSKAADTRQEEKLSAYRNLFLNTVTLEDPSFDEAAEIAALVARWQPIHIFFLREFLNLTGYHRLIPVDGQTEAAWRDATLQGLASSLQWDEDDVRRVWFELRASGVVEESFRRRRGMSEEKSLRLQLVMSTFGEKVVDFLSNPTASD